MRTFIFSLVLVIIAIFCVGVLTSNAQKVIRSVEPPTDLEYRPYAVRLYAVQKLPVVNNALMRWEATVVWHKYPTDWAEIEHLVVLPEFMRRRGYRICKDCPLEILPITPMP
jgi:hypothetical protein